MAEDEMMSESTVERVGDAVLADLLDRKGIRQVLEQRKDGDPAIWQELRSAIGAAAINQLYRPSDKVIDTVVKVYREIPTPLASDPEVVVVGIQRAFVAAVLAEHAERADG